MSESKECHFLRKVAQKAFMALRNSSRKVCANFTKLRTNRALKFCEYLMQCYFRAVHEKTTICYY